MEIVLSFINYKNNKRIKDLVTDYHKNQLNKIHYRILKSHYI